MIFVALSFAILRHSLPAALWFAALLGGISDLFSDDPMGVYALNYTLVTAFFYRFRRHLLWDSPLHLSLLTGLISSISALSQLALLFLFDRRVPFDGKWILTDLIGMPLVDAAVAFIAFSLPLLTFKKIHRLGMLFWFKRKHSSRTSPS